MSDFAIFNHGGAVAGGRLKAASPFRRNGSRPMHVANCLARGRGLHASRRIASGAQLPLGEPLAASEPRHALLCGNSGLDELLEIESDCALFVPLACQTIAEIVAEAAAGLRGSGACGGRRSPHRPRGGHGGRGLAVRAISEKRRKTTRMMTKAAMPRRVTISAVERRRKMARRTTTTTHRTSLPRRHSSYALLAALLECLTALRPASNPTARRCSSY